MKLAALLALLLTACTPETIPRAQVTLVVDAENGVRSAASRLRVDVFGGSTDESLMIVRQLDFVGETLAWPHEIALVPRDDDSTRRFSVAAIVVDTTGTPIAVARARSGYIDQRTLALPLLLEDACTNITCSSTETCTAGACTSADVAPSALLDFESSDAARSSPQDAAAPSG